MPVLTAAARTASAALGTTIFVMGVLTVLLLRSQLSMASGAEATPADPDELRASGASALEAALGPGGSGISFDVVQVSTLHAKPSGPRIELRSPDDQTKIVGETDEYQVGTAYSRGGVDHDVFWMEISVGPGAATFDESSLFARVLERDGKLNRTDSGGDSIVWRTMESWQTTAPTASGGIHLS